MTKKGLGQRVAYAVHRDLTLFHGLQQCGLGAGGGAVQLIGQKQVAQHCAGLINHAGPFGVGHGIAGHITGQYIGGELNAAVL